ncbi:MAG TPA: hypothetical protein VGN57_23170 [Pirellulaceae bacterium]|nr:hypothetical protein [Pirellulaceae bacterium]
MAIDAPSDADYEGDLFGIPASGTRIVYLIDCSDDVTYESIGKAKSATLKSLGTLRTDQEFLIVLYGSDVMPMFYPDISEDFSVASGSVRERIRRWLDSLNHELEGDSSPKNALIYALKKRPSTIFLLTGAPLTVEDVDAATTENGGRTAIHAVTYDRKLNVTNLRSLASKNGGRFERMP